MVWGCSSGAGLGPFVPVKGTLIASANQDILENFMPPTLWELFQPGPFLFQRDSTPVHKVRATKTWMTESGVDELNRPVPVPIEHLRDELQQRLSWAFSSNLCV